MTMTIEKQKIMKFLKIDEMDECIVINELPDGSSRVEFEGGIDECLNFLDNTDIPQRDLTLARKKDFKTK